MEVMKPIRFSDSPLRWVSALPMWPEGTLYHGQRFDFFSNRAAIEECLTRQITERQYLPPILKEHMPNGGTFGNAVDWRILEQDEAQALGIPQQAPVELYLGLDIRDAQLAADYDAGLWGYSSPDIRGTIVSGEPYIDETGQSWVFFIGEHSEVSVPHNKRQVGANHLRGVQMADGKAKMKCKMADGTVVEIESEDEMPEGAVMMDPETQAVDLAAQVAAQSADIQALKAMVEKLIAGGGAAPAMADPAAAAAPAAASPAGVPAPPAAQPIPATMSDAAVQRAVAQALAKQQAEHDVDAVIAAKGAALSRQSLMHLRMTDPTGFAAQFGDRAKPAATGRAAASGSKGAQFGSREHAVAMMDSCRKSDGSLDTAKMLKTWERERSGYYFHC